MKNNTNLVSIAVCSRNRRKSLANLVHSLKTMKTKYRFEIVVVEETDNPWQVDGVKYIPHKVKNYGIAYARNLALANSNGEIIVFIDDHIKWPTKNEYETIANAFNTLWQFPGVIGAIDGCHYPFNPEARFASDFYNGYSRAVDVGSCA